jgi:hypothetical protein
MPLEFLRRKLLERSNLQRLTQFRERTVSAIETIPWKETGQAFLPLGSIHPIAQQD